MKVVADADELAQAIGRVERAGAGYTTNFFASRAETERWIGSGGLSLVEGRRAVLIVRRDANFHRLFHIASDVAALSEAIAALVAVLPTTTLVTDLVGRTGSLQSILEAHCENGFVAYKRLLRMQRLTELVAEEAIDADVVRAGPDHAQRIREFMHRQLDPYSERIPAPDQLNDAMARGNVLVMLIGSEVAGLLIHETIGFTSTLRYWHVDPRFRNQGVGARLIKSFFRICRNSKRLLLWVIEGNDNAIAKYRHYGFRDDALVDEILVLRMEPASS